MYDSSFYVAVFQFVVEQSEAIEHFFHVVDVGLAGFDALLAVFGGHHLLRGVAEDAFGDGAIHLDGVDEVGSVVRGNEKVFKLLVKCLVGKQLLIVGEVVKVVFRCDEAHVRLEVAVEVLFAVFGRVDVEAVGHKNPCVHHEVAVLHRFGGFLRVEPHLELQGELVVDFGA